MANREDPEVLRLLVIFLRSHARMRQSDFGRASRVAQADISRCESGKQVPSEEALRRMAEAAGVPWEHVIHLHRFYTAGFAAMARRKVDFPRADETSLERTIAGSALLALSPYLLELKAGRETPLAPEEARREAAEIWTALERFPLRRRREMIEPSLHASRSWALAERICEASRRAASHKPDEALELASLALWIAGRVPGEEPWRSRLQGYIWAFIANARRAAHDLAGAGAALARAQKLWEAGAGAVPDLFPEWQLPDFEALAKARPARRKRKSAKPTELRREPEGV